MGCGGASWEGAGLKASGVQVGAQRNCGSDAGAREGFSEEEPFDLELER